MAISKQIVLMKKTIMLIVIARILKVLAIILLIAMLVAILTINLKFCINNDITNKADINKVMDENPCKIHQESEESKSREVSYSIEDFSSLLRDISRKNMNRMKICQLSQLNINSITNKFDLLAPAAIRNLDILLIRKTKIDSSFPEPQFENVGFATPYRETVIGEIYYCI